MIFAVDHPSVRQNDVLVRTVLIDGGLDAVLPFIMHELPEPTIPHLGLNIGRDLLLEEKHEALIKEHGAAEVT